MMAVFKLQALLIGRNRLAFKWERPIPQPFERLAERLRRTRLVDHDRVVRTLQPAPQSNRAVAVPPIPAL